MFGNDERDDAVFRMKDPCCRSRPSNLGEAGFLGRKVMWLHADVSGEIAACGDVLTMHATRACSVHRRFLFCNAEVLANCNEETGLAHAPGCFVTVR